MCGFLPDITTTKPISSFCANHKAPPTFATVLPSTCDTILHVVTQFLASKSSMSDLTGRF